MADQLASAIVGALRPVVEIGWVKADLTPEDLGAATLSGKILCVRTGVDRDIAGSLTITDGPNGLFEWAYAEADVATSGLHFVQFNAAYPGAQPTPAKTFAALWYVELAL